MKAVLIGAMLAIAASLVIVSLRRINAWLDTIPGKTLAQKRVFMREQHIGDISSQVFGVFVVHVSLIIVLILVMVSLT